MGNIFPSRSQTLDNNVFTNRKIIKQMGIFSELRLKLRFILLPTIWATIILYITFHMIQGERGLIAFMQIHGEVLAAKTIQRTLISKKNRLQNKVALLSLKSLDIDMLEERVRIMLGYSRPNETIILLK